MAEQNYASHAHRPVLTTIKRAIVNWQPDLYRTWARGVARSPRPLMTREDRDQFLKILHAHAQTIEICEACAATTRDLAIELQRGGVPTRDDLRRTVEEAENVLADLTAVRDEVRRLLIEFS